MSRCGATILVSTRRGRPSRAEPPSSRTPSRLGSHTVIFLLDHLVGVDHDCGDAFSLHALQVRPHLVGMVLAEVVEQHGAIGALGHQQLGGQDVAAKATAIAFA
jgi:hypothetical protein